MRASSISVVSTLTLLFIAAPLMAHASGISETLALGSKGAQVIELQQMLEQEGYLTVPPTGYFGSLTQTAVEQFQRVNGLAAVGYTGPKTRALLNATGSTSVSSSTSTSSASYISSLEAELQQLEAELAALEGNATRINGGGESITTTVSTGGGGGGEGGSSIGGSESSSPGTIVISGMGNSGAPPVTTATSTQSGAAILSVVNGTPLTATVGVPVTFSSTIQNTGTGTMPGGFSNIGMICDSTCNGFAQQVQTSTATSIAPGGSALDTWSYIFTTPGTYYYRLCANSWSVCAPNYASVIVSAASGGSTSGSSSSGSSATPTPPTTSTTTILPVTLSSNSAPQNGTVSITYNWNALPMNASYVVFVHFIDANGNIAFQDDHYLPNNMSTQTWSGPVSYTRTVSIPAAAAIGTYTITSGLFLSSTGYPKTQLATGSGVTQYLTDEYKVGTLTVTAGTNLPLSPTVPAAIGMPVQSPIAGAGDSLSGVTYSDDFHPAGFTLAFHDEFNAASLNTNTWTNQYVWGNRTLTGNAEQECYLEGNVATGNGILTLTALKQSVICPKLNAVQPYTSGMISSSISYVQKYGYFVMRAKLPAGQGLWPAFWLLPADASWPPEIDAFEVLENNPSTIYTTYHWIDGNGANQQDSKAVSGPDTSAGYHTYAVDWEPNSITWYVDGAQVFQHVGADVTNKPMYILANLAVGGSWPGNPNSSTVFPAQMQIDYIRAYTSPASASQ